MPLVSEDPRTIELPDLRLVGTMSLVDFRENQDPAVFQETWARFSELGDTLSPHRTNPERTFGLNLFPPTFPGDMRWYYGACVEVTTLEQDYPSSLLARYLPAASYHAFEVVGPASEIAPAYDRAWEILAGIHGGKPTCPVNLELYDQRFTGPDDPSARMDLLFPTPPAG